MGAGCGDGTAADALFTNRHNKATLVTDQRPIFAGCHTGRICAVETAACLEADQTAGLCLLFMDTAGNGLLAGFILMLVDAGNDTGQAARAVLEITNNLAHVYLSFFSRRQQ